MFGTPSWEGACNKMWRRSGNLHSSPVLPVPAVWSVVVSVSVVFAVTEWGVWSFPGLSSWAFPVGFRRVPLFTALMVSSWRLMPVWAAAVPAALVLVRVVLQPFNIWGWRPWSDWYTWTSYPSYSPCWTDCTCMPVAVGVDVSSVLLQCLKKDNHRCHGFLMSVQEVIIKSCYQVLYLSVLLSFLDCMLI